MCGFGRVIAVDGRYTVRTRLVRWTAATARAASRLCVRLEGRILAEQKGIRIVPEG
jgi:hypothetical protein